MELRAVPDTGTMPDTEGHLLRSRIAVDLADDAPVLAFGSELADVVDSCLADDANDWLVLVDTQDRPVHLVERAALLRGEPFEHRVSVMPADATPKACARQAGARSRVERLRPLVCCDAAGRFLGLIRVERLLETLAADA
jgi:hypothetical protein